MMKKLLCLLTIIAVVGINAQAQISSYEQSREAMRNNSFSLANSSYTAPKYETIRYNDGSVFNGRTFNGIPIQGVIEKSNGTKIHCDFADGYITGLCLTEHTDGSWYVGLWKNGNMHGEGTYYVAKTGTYLNLVYQNGTIISKTKTTNPNYTKQSYYSWQQQRGQALQESLRENELYYNNNTTTTTRSSSSRSSSSSRQCGVCHGTGKCNTCNGKGYYRSIGIGSGTHSCTSCGHTGRCRSCNGTGRR